MPATTEVPTIPQLLEAFAGAVATRNTHPDTHRGSMYDHAAGVGALLFRRVALRNRDMFRGRYFALARAGDLDFIVEKRYPDVDARAQLSAGTGSALLTRPSAGAGAGTIRAGTRIAVARAGAAKLVFYQVASDLAVSATELSVAVAVKALDMGTGSSVSITTSAALVLRIEDPLWDNTWAIQELTCGAGTDYELDDTLRARVRDTRVAERPGYDRFLIDVCQRAGAKVVALFPSDYTGSDSGLNRIFVADAGYSTPADLLLACRVSMYGAAVLGTSVQVLPITQTDLSVALTIRTWQQPQQRDTAADAIAAKAAVVNYFRTRKNVFVWRESQIRTAVQAVVRGSQSVDIATSSSEPSLSTLMVLNPLPAYFVRPETITVSMLGPTT